MQGILKSEKYMGDALLQKTITTDFIEKTRIKNNGSVPQYYIKDRQEAIIPRDIFTQVQEEMVEGLICLVVSKAKRKEFTPANMHLPAFAPARNAATFTTELLGTIEANIPLLGVAALGLKMVHQHVMHLWFRKQSCSKLQ